MGKYFQMGNQMYSLVDMNEYTTNREVYNPHNTAILINGYVYPIRSQLDNTPGIYYQPGAMCCFIKKPEDLESFSINNPSNTLMDFDSSEGIGEFIDKTKILKDIEQDVMLTNENIFHLKPSIDDQPQMKALKEAINSKNIDKRNYERRFPQFNNDFRMLKGHRITLAKLVSTCNAFDIDVTLTLTDRPDAPNPMNKKITVKLTGDDENE